MWADFLPKLFLMQGSGHTLTTEGAILTAKVLGLASSSVELKVTFTDGISTTCNTHRPCSKFNGHWCGSQMSAVDRKIWNLGLDSWGSCAVTRSDPAPLSQ